MRSIFDLCLNILTFGILPLIKWLVKRKTQSRTDTIKIDLNNDGKVDILVDFSPDQSDSDEIIETHHESE